MDLKIFKDPVKSGYIYRILTNCYKWQEMEKRLRSRKWFENIMSSIMDVLDLSDEDIEWFIDISEDFNEVFNYQLLFPNDKDMHRKIQALHGILYLSENIGEWGIEDVPVSIIKKLYLIRAIRHVCRDFLERCEDYFIADPFHQYLKNVAAWNTYQEFGYRDDLDSYSVEDMKKYYTNLISDLERNPEKLGHMNNALLAGHLQIDYDPEMGLFGGDSDIPFIIPA